MSAALLAVNTTLARCPCTSLACWSAGRRRIVSNQCPTTFVPNWRSTPSAVTELTGGTMTPAELKR
jgi:hypothetical protein